MALAVLQPRPLLAEQRDEDVLAHRNATSWRPAVASDRALAPPAFPATMGRATPRRCRVGATGRAATRRSSGCAPRPGPIDPCPCSGRRARASCGAMRPGTALGAGGTVHSICTTLLRPGQPRPPHAMSPALARRSDVDAYDRGGRGAGSQRRALPAGSSSCLSVAKYPVNGYGGAERDERHVDAPSAGDRWQSGTRCAPRRSSALGLAGAANPAPPVPAAMWGRKSGWRLGTWRARFTAALHCTHRLAPRFAGRAQIAQRLASDSAAIEATVISVSSSMPTPGVPMTLA